MSKSKKQKSKLKIKKSNIIVNLKIRHTEDLDQFKRLAGNRPVNDKHVSRLIRSIANHGMQVSPILINELKEVIDGQHRLAAARELGCGVYYIEVKGYGLPNVHILNANQKNWQTKDFMEAYAREGIEDYVILKEFYERHKVFTLTDCIGFCKNTTQTYNHYSETKAGKEVFRAGTWKVRDMDIAETWANNLKQLQPYYEGYTRSRFIGAVITMFNNEKFDFAEFMVKLRQQPTRLVHCVDRNDYRNLFEDIYNYRRRDKVNLRF